jgi:hypothetical protein
MWTLASASTFVAAFDTLCRARTVDGACYFYETRDLG